MKKFFCKLISFKFTSDPKLDGTAPPACQEHIVSTKWSKNRGNSTDQLTHFVHIKLKKFDLVH